MDEIKTDENIKKIEKYLRRVDYITKVEGRKIISDLGITGPQFGALQILIHNGDLTISELSQKMGLACSTITDLIDRMEKTELVIRKKNEKDRRSVIVEALPKGYEVLEQVLNKRREFIRDKLSGFSKEEIEGLSMILEKLYISVIENY